MNTRRLSTFPLFTSLPFLSFPDFITSSLTLCIETSSARPPGHLLSHEWGQLSRHLTGEDTRTERHIDTESEGIVRNNYSQLTLTWRTRGGGKLVGDGKY